MSVSSPNQANTISFSEHKIASPAFQKLYDEGMSLVEETATYLDGAGRTDAKFLSRPATSLYAAESMRLTTRLMQVSSWLLLHRAHNAGEMTANQVEEERVKIRLDSTSADRETAGWEEQPAQFLDLIARSLRLQHRVRCLDSELYPDTSTRSFKDNPVTAQLNLLKTAFGD